MSKIIIIKVTDKMGTFTGILVMISIINLMITLWIWHSLTNTQMCLKSINNIENNIAILHKTPSIISKTIYSYIIENVDMVGYYTKKLGKLRHFIT